MADSIRSSERENKTRARRVQVDVMGFFFFASHISLQAQILIDTCSALMPAAQAEGSGSQSEPAMC